MKILSNKKSLLNVIVLYLRNFHQLHIYGMVDCKGGFGYKSIIL